MQPSEEFSAENSSLHQLYGRAVSKKFLEKFWPERLFVYHGGKKTLEAFQDHKFLFNLSSISDGYQDHVNVWRPEFFANGVKRNGPGSLILPAKAALAHYEFGSTLYFTGIQRFFPSLQNFCRQLEKDLGVFPGSCRLEFFASRKGAGTVPHFDHELNISIQLVGRKAWRAADNQEVVHPLNGFKPSDGPLAGELLLYSPAKLENRVPEPRRIFKVKPGSLVFLPHGYWHETKALDDCLAMTVVIHPPSWVEHFLNKMRRRLVADVNWRQRITGASSDPETLARLEKEWEKLDIPLFRNS